MDVEGRDIRLRILRSATELFMEKGYGPTTVNEIIDRADIAKGTFYHHFNSKEGLLSEVADRIKDKYMSAMFEAASLPGLDSMQKFEAIERAIADVEETDWIGRELQDGQVAPALLLKVLRQSIQEGLPHYLAMIAEGKEEGSINTPYELSAAILVMIMNIVSLRPDLIPREELAHFRRAVLLSHENKSQNQGCCNK